MRTTAIALSFLVAVVVQAAPAVESFSVPVTSEADFGPGSLRAAIEEINANPACGTEVTCFIGFTLAPGGKDPMTIGPATPLPPIRKCNVRLGGPDDLEQSWTVKHVVISGENVTYGNGLEVRATCGAGIPGVTIESIAVNSWPWNGIYFEAPEAHPSDFEGHFVNRVFVGTDHTGLVARPNGSRGIITDSPHEVIQIYNSVASGNFRSGIAFFRGKRAVVIGSHLGVDRNFHAMGNGGAGLFSIGVPFRAALNTIAFNGMGVAVDEGTREAGITDNDIHSNLGLAIDWGLDARTPSDDEHDGVPNAPRITNAFYDGSANVTYVSGVVYLRAGELGSRFIIEPYLSNAHGDAVAQVPEFPTLLTATTEGSDVTFNIGVPGDFRGKYLAVQAHAANDRNQRLLSSEISEPIAVP